MYHVIVSQSVRKSIARIDKRYQKRIDSALDFLQVDPLSGKKLGGEMKGRYVIRVWPYRIIYEVDRERHVVVVRHIGHRQGAY